ncbi:acyl carrier protein [Streptomyces sp. H34-S4]|uniref:acyl carrier protein n=1 Tax=Streptomyces sp. H34-S4 TaxID=2996463 RepID=UPI0022714D68|nr:acyl carrier protein [Streptomyces sp. H34-S4]MCY0935092.1 acyl carrier protein [Streptomyces sp. H34-S4]
MTSERLVPARRHPAVPADVLTDVVGVLGDVLRIKPEKIDPEQSFQSIGLDSLLTVELVAVVNARYGTAIVPTDMYEHPTPASFARQVATELKRVGTTVPAAAQAWAAEAAGAAQSAAPQSPAAEPTATAVAEEIEGVLREQLAAVLCCDVWDIGPAATFSRLGLDSMLGAEFVATINRTFGLQERAVVLYDHSDLAALARHVAEQLGTAPCVPATVAVHELDVLLDAVRDDRLTVDEALVLLARRG